MKVAVTFVSFVLGAVALPANSALQERSEKDLGDAYLQGPTVLKALKIESLQPLVDDKAKRTRLTYGPFKIKGLKSNEQIGNAKSMDPAGTAYNHPLGPDFPKDITILESISKVVDDKGEKYDLAKGIYNHHNLFTDITKPTDKIINCDGTPKAASPSSLFMAGATEDGYMIFGRKDSQVKSGYYIGKNDMIVMSGDIVNYNNDTVDVYIQGEIEYLPGKQAGYLDAQHQTIGTEFCTSSGVNPGSVNAKPPSGLSKWSHKSEQLKFAKDGYWVNAVGHLHDGGSKFIVRLNGREVCSSRAIYGGKGHEQKQSDGSIWKTLSQMTSCPGFIPVKKGDTMDFEAYFDTTEHPQRKHHDGAMAESMMLLLGQFASSS